MELKDYQQKVIADVAHFLACVAAEPDVRAAFRTHWLAQGVATPDVYQARVRDAAGGVVPHVCLKVPTAGGKTFLAANALRPIFETLNRFQPEQPKAVIWLVPSLTILDQTLRNLRDSQHPYRVRLNTHFNGRVAVHDKKDVLHGAGFNADAVREQLTVIVLSFDSLRARNKEDRKIFQENSYLDSFARQQAHRNSALPEYDDSALINVLRGLQPVVIVDESHNAETSLSVEMLANLNPRFILDLTATPRNHSNIISYVDAAALRRQNMVKLPIIVKQETDKTAVIQTALNFQRKLEALAQDEAAHGGKYIRPIVLFQAETNAQDDNTTFEKVKKSLLKVGIPPAQIRIKTANLNEIKDEDLLSPACPVRFIITINALKEGWDCPFAYILASLGNKSSVVDVEQIIGRVLRQPYVRPHRDPLLNLSYVFTPSSDMLKTLDKIVAGLNRAGFSEREARRIENSPAPDPDALARQQATVQHELFALNETINTAAANVLAHPAAPDEEEIETDRIILATPAAALSTVPPADAALSLSDDSSRPVAPALETVTRAAHVATQAIENIAAQALRLNDAYEQTLTQNDTSLPAEVADKMNRYPMKEVFAAAQQLRLPQFFLKLPSFGGMFEAGEDYHLFTPNEALKDFRLAQCDAQIHFDAADGDFYEVDLEAVGPHNYKTSFHKLDPHRRAVLNEVILAQPPAAQLDSITKRLCDLMGSPNELHDKDLKNYVRRVLEQLSTAQLREALERDLLYSQRIAAKIWALADEFKEKQFSNYLDIDRVTVRPHYAFPPTIAPTTSAPAIVKSLYTHEAAMNGFEQIVANDLANLSNVIFWHRNIEKKGFALNGFLNHYPDFIVHTKSGKTLLVEAKGDYLDGSDSARKLRLGQLWASKAGNDYRYFMVFQNKAMDGAHRLPDFLRLAAQM